VVDLLVVNKADGDTKAAAELSARQLRNALESTKGAELLKNSPDPFFPVLTCSALHNEGIDAVWTVVRERHARMTADGTLAERRKQQNLHWLWATVEDRLRQSIYANPQVQALRESLEQQVLAETISVEAAARKILEACGKNL
jgi:LAO/AO transport system kinase